MPLIERTTFCPLSTHRCCAFTSWYSHPFIQTGLYSRYSIWANAGNFGLELLTTPVTFLSTLKAGVWFTNRVGHVKVFWKAGNESRGKVMRFFCFNSVHYQTECWRGVSGRKKEKDPRRYKYWANSISQLIVEIKNNLWRDKGKC